LLCLANAVNSPVRVAHNANDLYVEALGEGTEIHGHLHYPNLQACLDDRVEISGLLATVDKNEQKAFAWLDELCKALVSWEVARRGRKPDYIRESG
jgi:hypothetical protein